MVSNSLLSYCSLVFLTGVLQGFPIYKMFLVGVSLAVAAIPEGCSTCNRCLSHRRERMIRCNAIIRQLPAVETPGLCHRYLF